MRMLVAFLSAAGWVALYRRHWIGAGLLFAGAFITACLLQWRTKQ